MIDASVKNELLKKYGADELMQLTGGFTNAVYLLKGTTPLMVAKIAQWSDGDSDNEDNNLKFLKEAEFTPKWKDSFFIGPVRVSIFSYVEGINGQALLDTGDLERSIALFSDMGKLLATQIHSIPFTGQGLGLRQADYEASPFVKLDDVPQELVQASLALLAPLKASLKSEWTFTHGDFGSHNILAHERRLAVIDWEWAEWGHPLVDIAWTCWNTALHYPTLAPQLNPAFIQAYQRNRPLVFTPELLKSCVIYKLGMILLKVKQGDESTKQKWISRLAWTLEHEWV
ncbi:hypothetical protein GCM10011391_09720 [Pullulanibacillus camelliae]|uniref:Aminoglycoside phosphotransferase domain-containing protein n=1 Tax=Pullulanibacillus camelliae TaxID=1707096 RepID=A0A8J2YG71_9BACL|nr:aminoglycoside phosphotransferase family protein [Pullulanibacillus camelliae]GGE33123.1 hypothetical protein GCM10011391_09720 [Pullulanibacillus camelliae]